MSSEDRKVQQRAKLKISTTFPSVPVNVVGVIFKKKEKHKKLHENGFSSIERKTSPKREMADGNVQST